MGNTKRMRIPDSLERLLSGRKLMGARGKRTTLPVSYQELLSTVPKGLRGNQSIALITSKKDKREVAETDSGS